VRPRSWNGPVAEFRVAEEVSGTNRETQQKAAHSNIGIQSATAISRTMDELRSEISVVYLFTMESWRGTTY